MEWNGNSTGWRMVFITWIYSFGHMSKIRTELINKSIGEMVKKNSGSSKLMNKMETTYYQNEFYTLETIYGFSELLQTG